MSKKPSTPDPIADFKVAAPATFPHAPEKSSLWGKLKRGLFMTHTEIIDRMDAAMHGRGVLDEKSLDYLEEMLIAADLGVETSLDLVEHLKSSIKKEEVRDLARIREILAEAVAQRLAAVDRPLPGVAGQPRITLVVGVNGVGKTTTIAKLARLYHQQGKKVLLAAGDTFRAAAIDQLVTWGERVGVEVVRQKPGGDPAAVVFDALQAARARRIDHVVIDTAGRLHTKDNLMQELAKIGRIIQREAGDYAIESLLVLDATTGHNAVQQAREFVKVAAVDGVILTKLDGTAKGGMAVAVATELRLPIRFIGVGEKADDLLPFQPREFAAALFE